MKISQATSENYLPVKISQSTVYEWVVHVNVLLLLKAKKKCGSLVVEELFGVCSRVAGISHGFQATCTVCLKYTQNGVMGRDCDASWGGRGEGWEGTVSHPAVITPMQLWTKKEQFFVCILSFLSACVITGSLWPPPCQPKLINDRPDRIANLQVVQPSVTNYCPLFVLLVAMKTKQSQETHKVMLIDHTGWM